MKRTLTLTFALLLLCAVPAGAATTIGATTAGTPTVIPSNCAVATDNVPVSCSLYLGNFADQAELAPGGLSAPANGVITKWRVDVGPHTATSLVLKPRVLQFFQIYTMMRSGIERTIPASGGTFTFDDRLPIERRDYFAIDSVANGLAGAGPPIVANIGSNASYLTKSPAVPDGGTFPIQIVIGGPTQTKLLINADIEPDVDLDGYGDETQDKCVQRSDVHDACPKPSISGKAKATTNGFTVTVDRAAKAQITIDKVGKGRKVGKKCKKSAKQGKKCDVFTKLAQWNEDLVAGVNKISYAYKVGGKKLKKGSYRATIVITNAEGGKVTSSFKFKIKK